MGTRAAATVMQVPQSRPALLSSGNMEALKASAFVLMIGAHLARYVLGEADGLAVAMGRVVFPLFAICFAAALAEAAPGGARRACFSLAPWAVAAQLLMTFVRSDVLNVLFLFVAASAYIAAEREKQFIHRWALRALALAVGTISEFSLPGFFLIVAAIHFAEYRSRRSLAWCCIWLLALGYLESWWTLVAVPLVWVFAYFDITMPRVRGFFAPAYVAHWFFIVVLAGVL